MLTIKYKHGGIERVVETHAIDYIFMIKDNKTTIDDFKGHKVVRFQQERSLLCYDFEIEDNIKVYNDKIVVRKHL